MPLALAGASSRSPPSCSSLIFLSMHWSQEHFRARSADLRAAARLALPEDRAARD
ncbi:MAG: hypothetical protein MZW92_53040 [Comamonadaceae bacterium]|nr:hypothetical protein [Comamonadaceae bacterium]